jgi:hypothetical protein
MRHNVYLNKYISHHVPSTPPLQLFEVYAFWAPFISYGLGAKHCPTVKHVADHFIKFLKGRLRNPEILDFETTRTVSLQINDSAQKKYEIAMKAYPKNQNTITIVFKGGKKKRKRKIMPFDKWVEMHNPTEGEKEMYWKHANEYENLYKS